MRVPVIQHFRVGESEEEEDEEEEKVFCKPVIEDRNMELAKRCTELISDIHYKEEYEKSKGKCIFVPDTPQLNHVKNISAFISEAKYKGSAKKDLSNSIYKQMPATIDSVFAKEVTQLQSKVLYRQKHDAEKGASSYAHMKEPPDVMHAMEVSKHQSNVSYKKDVEDMHRYTEVLNRPDIKMATGITKIISNTEYKKGRGEMNKESAVLGRSDFEHAKEVSKLLSQVKYKEQFNKEMKSHQYNPLDSAAFKQAQIAATLASDVKYKKDMESLHDPVSDLPNLLYLEHALNISKTHSNYEYKKLFERSKGLYHFALDTAEQMHHKENAVLQSQVKYKEDYEKSKGKSMLEFVDTPIYQVSKEVQKIQSEKAYCKDFEEMLKGKATMDLDRTPEFLHIKHVTNLLKEKEYKKDLETEIKGKGMQVGTDTPEMQRVKKASEIQSGGTRGHACSTGPGMQQWSAPFGFIGMLFSEGNWIKVGSIYCFSCCSFKCCPCYSSQKEYKKDLETEIKGKGMQVGMDTPEIQRAKNASEIASQKMYKDEAGKMLCNYSAVPDTPEIERIKSTQKNISSVFYKEEVGAGTAVKETPEIERVKKNQQNISSVKYREELKQATAISDPPELKRVKENQKNISNVQYKEQHCKATSVIVTPEIERVKKNQENVKYKEEIKQATAISDPLELKRVKENQKNISDVQYKDQLCKATSVSVTPEIERVKKNQENVKYSSDQRQMKGRPSVILDTPELRHVRETQNNISMVKYHEDFEKTKGRGFTPVVDDPVTERVRKNTQVMSDAAYKGVHPHIVEMDRRPGIIVDLKVWRTDPGSVFDIDPLEDNIQSRSLHMLSEKASRYNKQHFHSTSATGMNLGDDKLDGSEMNSSFSYSSEVTRPSDEGAPVLPGAYQQSQSQGYGYMHQTSMSSMRSLHSQPHSRTYRAMYDYSAQDEDEVSFRDGDYIVNVQPIDDGWMYGTVQRTGKTGMLPANYIEFVN
uniref:Nebulette n=1 Tax=Crocodylus porosus TaxID=8502 RepID=A0A7M4FX46_CROPO